MLKFVPIALVLIALVSCQYTKLQWKLCHTASDNPAGEVNLMDISPMPIAYPGPHTLNITGELTRNIQGALKTDMILKKSVFGLQLTISCILMNGIFVGSCTYADFCDFIMTAGEYDELNCPEDALQYGIDCTCPFKIPMQIIDVSQEVQVPDLGTSILATLFTNGDYEVQLKASDDMGFIGCVNVKFSLKKAPVNLTTL